MSRRVQVNARAEHRAIADGHECAIEDDAAEVHEDAAAEANERAIVALKHRLDEDALAHLAHQVIENLVPTRRLVGRSGVVRARQLSSAQSYRHQLGIVREVHARREHALPHGAEGRICQIVGRGRLSHAAS